MKTRKIVSLFLLGTILFSFAACSKRGTGASVALVTEATTPPPRPEYEISVNPSAVGDTVIIGCYEQGSGLEPIEWRVLAIEGNRALIITEKAIECKKYNLSRMEVTWETCTLRAWLNEDFINAAFDATEQARIVTTTLTTADNTETGMTGGNDTSDKVFLLSVEEALQYFPDDASRQCYCTTYADERGIDPDQVTGYVTWTLRTPGMLQDCVVSTYTDGTMSYNGLHVEYEHNGIRPAMWINIG